MTIMNNHEENGDIMAFPANIEVPEEKIVTQEKQTESSELNKLFEALAKAQLEMEVAKTDSINPYFKSRYADLASVVKASRPFLAKNSLCIIQRAITKDEGDIFLYTRLCHSSGQWIESNMQVKPPKSDIQTMGSYLTYLRRYMYAALVGVVSSDEDDDGENAMHDPREKKQEKLAVAKISRAQLEVLSSELSDHEEILESLLKGFNIQKMADLPSKHYTKCVERIREIKRAKED